MLMTPEMYYLLKLTEKKRKEWEWASISHFKTPQELDAEGKLKGLSKDEINKNIDILYKIINREIIDYVSLKAGKDKDSVLSFLKENNMETAPRYCFVFLYDRRKNVNNVISERFYHFNNISFLKKLKVKKDIKRKVENGIFLLINDCDADVIKRYAEKGFFKFHEMYNKQNISSIFNKEKYELFKMIMDDVLKASINVDKNLLLREMLFSYCIKVRSKRNIDILDPSQEALEIALIFKDLPQEWIQNMMENIPESMEFLLTKDGDIDLYFKMSLEQKAKVEEVMEILKIHLEAIYLKKELINPESPSPSEIIVEKRKRL